MSQNLRAFSALFFGLLIGLGATPKLAKAERKPVKILDTSTSGQTIMITAGSRDGLKLKDPLLIRRSDKKLVAARVIRLFQERAAVYIVARYSREAPQKSDTSRKYNILYGIPLNVPNLPSEVEVVDELERNPQDETFFVEDGREREPEIDDDSYTPETTIRPEFPPPDYRKTHNITLGVEFFRNADLIRALDTEGVSFNNNSSTTYQGYTIRYGYNFRTYYWLKKKIPALITVEASLGIYSFNFNDLQLEAGGKKTRIEVIPIGAYLRYNYEFNPMFMAWAYVGFQQNFVSANNGYPETRIKDLGGNGVAFGLGGALAMSQTIDLRLDAGNDGFLFGGVVKF